MCKITLHTSGTTHCGYCSDPDNISSYVKKDRTFAIHDFPHKGYYNYDHPIKLNSDFNIDNDIKITIVGLSTIRIIIVLLVPDTVVAERQLL